MSDDAHGPLLTRYEVDPAEERALGRLRLVVALVALTAAALTLLGDLPLPAFMVAVLGLLVGLGWLAQARRARARASHAHTYFLAVHTRGFLLSEGGTPVWVPWREVRDIDVDEERLDIVITRTIGDPLRLEPRYQGVAIHALMDTLRNAWRGSHDPTPGA